MNRSPRPPSLCELATLFVRERELERGLKPSTITYYRTALGLFLATPGVPRAARDLSKVHAIEYTGALRARGCSPGGINAYQRPVWVWFRWLYANDYCPEDIARKVGRVPVKNPTRRTASIEIRSAMAKVAADHPEHSLRNVALIEVLWSAGPRKTELTLVDLADYDREEGTIALRHTKSGIPRAAGVGQKARLALEHYIVKERARGRDGEPLDGPLFLNRFDQRMTAAAVTCVIRKLARACGVQASAHDFRRAAIAQMWAAGMDPQHIKVQVGHSRVEQTAIYAHSVTAARAIRAFHEYDNGQRGKR